MTLFRTNDAVQIVRVLWICAALLGTAIYVAMLAWTLPAISAAAGGLAPFDMRPSGYTPEEARAFLSALSEDGHALYTGPQRWLDLFYPPLLAITLSGLILRFYRNAMVQRAFVIAAIGGMLADWGENILVAGLLAGDVSDRSIQMASNVTLAKSVLQSLAISASVFGLIRAALRQILRRPTGGA